MQEEAGHRPQVFATACLLLIILLLAGSYLSKTDHSRLLLVFLSGLLVSLLFLTRLLHLRLMGALRKYGIGLRRVVIVGESELARELANRIRNRRELNYEFAGFLFPTTGRTEVRFPPRHFRTV